MTKVVDSILDLVPAFVTTFVKSLMKEIEDSGRALHAMVGLQRGCIEKLDEQIVRIERANDKAEEILRLLSTPTAITAVSGSDDTKTYIVNLEAQVDYAVGAASRFKRLLEDLVAVNENFIRAPSESDLVGVRYLTLKNATGMVRSALSDKSPALAKCELCGSGDLRVLVPSSDAGPTADESKSVDERAGSIDDPRPVLR